MEVAFEEVHEKGLLSLFGIHRIEVEIVDVESLQAQHTTQLPTILLQPPLLTRTSRYVETFLLLLLPSSLRRQRTALHLGQAEKPVFFCFVEVVEGTLHVADEETEIVMEERQFGEESAMANHC